MQELFAYSTMAMTLGLVVTRPRLTPFLRISPAMAAIFGMFFLFAIGIVKPAHWLYALTNLWSPFIAIGSIMIMTDVAERIGLLKWWASRIETHATSTRQLFFLVFGLGVVTSSLLNNDAAILVLTPIVLTMVRRRYPNQPGLLVPFAFAVFMSAGVAALPVSNPMNMVVAEFSKIGFNVYARHMVPVAAAGWVIAYFLLRRIFSAQLDVAAVPTVSISVKSTFTQRLMMMLLVAVLVAYPIIGYIGGPVWAVALSGAILSLALAQRYLGARPVEVLAGGISWETLAFLLAVLVMSLGLRDVGLVDRLAWLYAESSLSVIGITSAIGSAILNNHPMSHLNMMALANVSPQDHLPVFAALVGGDLGPRLLPMGSLAGLIWLEQLRRNGVDVSIWQFFKIGLILAVPTVAASLTILALF